jgi:formylglycine-generating enzyme required for sulfatase activity
MQALRKIGLAAAALLTVVAVARGSGTAWRSARVQPPELVELTPGVFAYRTSGAFTRDGKPASAPIVTARISQPLALMRHQVTVAEYRRCVDAGACPAAARNLPDRPIVEVSWYDAQSYAAWLSRATGMAFRLPSDEEWAYAAGERFADDALPDRAERGDPGQRSLARYDLELGGDPATDQMPQPVGRFGANAKGLLDLAGNVWEWTDTCFARIALDTTGRTENCGVRVVEGRHRTYLPDFVRTARGGGCSVGIRVSNVGFRLVRDDGAGPVQRAVMAALRFAGLNS